MPLDPTTERHLLARLARSQSERRIPSLVAGLVRGGELVWSAGRGEVEGIEPDHDVQYRIGSITKTFVAVLVMRLRDEGLIDLARPVTSYVPDCGLGAATVAQVLSHTSGLRSETNPPWWERTAGGDYAHLAADTLGAAGARVGDPGRRFHYSNTGFGLLGQLVAQLRDAPWHEVLQAEVLAPLGMSRTTVRPASPAAQGYAVHPWADVLLAEPEHDHGAMAPAGQLWSTVADLARWASFLAGDTGDVLAPATLEEMARPIGLNDGDGAWTGAYGLGLQVWNNGGRRTLGHGGSMPGFLALLETEPHGGDGVVLAANTTAGWDADLGTELLAILRAREPRIVPAWRPTPVDEQHLLLTGIWYWGPTPVGIRADEGGALAITGIGRGGRTSRFAPSGTDRWTGLDGYYAGETLVAVRAADGTPSALELGSFVYTRAPYAPGVGVPGGDVPWETS